MTQATLSAGQSGIGFKRTRDIVTLAHLEALIAAKPRTQAMIRDAVWAGVLPGQILEARLSEVIETATTTYLSALDDEDKATAKLTAGGWASPTRPSHPSNIPAPSPKTKTVTALTSQRPG